MINNECNAFRHHCNDTRKITVIEGGRDAIERNLVIALFEVDIAKVDKLSAQLDAIAKKSPTELRVFSNLQKISDPLNQD
jgi:hypothetical protein